MSVRGEKVVETVVVGCGLLEDGSGVRLAAVAIIGSLVLTLANLARS